MRHIIIYMVSLMLITSCGNSKKSADMQEPRDTAAVEDATDNTKIYDPYCTDFSSYEAETSTAEESQSNSISNGYFPRNIPMSREEDVYEEARSLAEEDRLNGTRMHEGDDYDEDYEDDYDEGYEE